MDLTDRANTSSASGSDVGSASTNGSKGAWTGEAAGGNAAALLDQSKKPGGSETTGSPGSEKSTLSALDAAQGGGEGYQGGGDTASSSRSENLVTGDDAGSAGAASEYRVLFNYPILMAEEPWVSPLSHDEDGSGDSDFSDASIGNSTEFRSSNTGDLVRQRGGGSAIQPIGVSNAAASDGAVKGLKRSASYFENQAVAAAEAAASSRLARVPLQCRCFSVLPPSRHHSCSLCCFLLSSMPAVVDAGTKEDRRRELNRLNAKRSRLRKRYFTESMAAQVKMLQDRNKLLRTFISKRLKVDPNERLRAYAEDEAASASTSDDTPMDDSGRPSDISSSSSGSGGRSGNGKRPQSLVEYLKEKEQEVMKSSESSSDAHRRGVSVGDRSSSASPSGNGGSTSGNGNGGSDSDVPSSQNGSGVSRTSPVDLLEPISSKLHVPDLARLLRVESSSMSFIITDPSRHDDPIVFASKSFERLTGYTSTEIFGKNCRFLQGKGTDPNALQRIKKALAVRFLLICSCRSPLVSL